jgi:hypothetical protein
MSGCLVASSFYFDQPQQAKGISNVKFKIIVSYD